MFVVSKLFWLIAKPGNLLLVLRVLGLILFEDVGLHRAPHTLQHVGADARVGLGIHDLVSGDAEQREAEAVVTGRQWAHIARKVAVPEPLDVVCARAGLDTPTALVYLLQLEFRGLVRQLAGKQFARA